MKLRAKEVIRLGSQGATTVLFCDDDVDDLDLVVDGWQDAKCVGLLETFDGGAKLLDALSGFTGSGLVVLLDLNMPGVDGWTVLKRMKADPELRHIPVVIFTTSSADHDIHRSYDEGAAGFITKPSSYDDLVTVLSGVDNYWDNTVQLHPAT